MPENTNGLRGVFADEMLRCGSGVHGNYNASGRGNHRQTVELTAYNGQTRLMRHMSTVQFFFNLRNLFSSAPMIAMVAMPSPNPCKLLIHGMVPAFWFFHFYEVR